MSPRPALWPHVLGLALLVGVLIPLIQPFGTVSVDEGAAAHQAIALSEDGTWAVAPPLPAIDRSDLVFPIIKSEPLADGYAPFLRHPLYAVVLAMAHGAVGTVGLVLVSALGVVLAASGAAVLARRFSEGGLPVAALWVTGLASPLLFDGYLLIAHAIGAAVVVWLVVVTLRAAEQRSGLPALVPVVVLAVLAVLLRTEALLLVLAIAAASVVAPVGRRSRWWRVAGPSLAGAALGLAIERVWRGQLGAGEYVVGGPVGRTVDDPSGWIQARWDGVAHSVVGAGPGRPGMLLGVSLLLLVVAALLARMRVATVLVPPVTIAAVALVLLRFGSDRELVPGLLLAFPLIAVVVVLAVGRVALPVEARWTGLVVALAAVGVVATQYEGGGYVEWGGRYFAILLPIAVPVLLLALQLAADGDAPARQVGVAALACSALLSVLSIATMRDTNRHADAVLAQVGALAPATNLAGDPPDERPVLVTSHFGLGRLDWRRWDDHRWLYLGPDLPDLPQPDPQVAAVRGVLTEPRIVTLVTEDPARDLERIGPHVVVEEHEGIGPFTVLVLQLPSRQGSPEVRRG